MIEKVKSPAERPIKVIIMTHVEGDEGEIKGSVRCGDLTYQEGGLPKIGEKLPYDTYEIDIAGTELMFETLQNYTDSLGKSPRLFIEPVGSFWHTEGDPVYGGQLARKYDYLSLGCEFGIQTHNIYYAGKGFCWIWSPPTPKGIWRRLADMHCFAERVYQNGRKVNGGLTFTGGHKNASPPMDPREAEYVIDHTANILGYKISYEDWDGHWQSKPQDIEPNCACPYAYQADYGDGVKMLKIDFNGMITADSPLNTPRCEQPHEALARFDRTVAAQLKDKDPSHIYYFATTFHSNFFWQDHHAAKSGQPLGREGLGLKLFMEGLQERKEAGVQMEFITPRELLKEFESLPKD
ncbi:MAG: hypothetical protein H0S82_04650 [Anaerolineaceae bacterium]|nr:hypothetical protein [Anaerolineaceae bacterium]